MVFPYPLLGLPLSLELSPFQLAWAGSCRGPPVSTSQQAVVTGRHCCTPLSGIKLGGSHACLTRPLPAEPFPGSHHIFKRFAFIYVVGVMCL